MTFAGLRERVDRLAVGLMRAGIKKGECVVLQLPNWAEYVYSYFALQKIGAIPVILISGYRQLEVGHLCKLTEATAWIVPVSYRKIDYASFVGDVKSLNPQLKQIISVRAEGQPPGFTTSLEGLMGGALTAEVAGARANKAGCDGCGPYHTVRWHDGSAEGHTENAQ